MSEDEAYRRALEQMENKERMRAEEERIAAVARKEIDRRIEGWVLFIGLIGLISWQGWLGFGIWLACVAGIVSYEKWVEDRTPGADPDSAERDAMHYVRHCILAELEQRGELGWEVKDGEVTIAEHPLWGSFWTRVNDAVASFERAKPKDRRKQVAQAKSRSLRARQEMMSVSHEHKAKPLWWATVEPSEAPPNATESWIVRRVRSLPDSKLKRLLLWPEKSK
jgi:hypothetical protein